ncbi:MAG: hypothetical protein BWZ06_01710 [Bacteroidetes bacterium ADurb.BinA261]|nr:MAG: hypothetical protein BWZ06_01710 [Bacteroidetes bacterium ADurb.BinA261]
MKGLKTTGHRFEHRERLKHILFVQTQQTTCAIHGQQVINIENANELHREMFAVDLDISALEMFFENTRLEIGHIFHRIGVYLCFGILYHHLTIFVVDVSQSKSFGRKTVKKRFLHIPIFEHVFVIVEMILSEVGEYAACEMQSVHPLLMNGM